MKKSKLIKAFHWIFTLLLLFSLAPLALYQGDKTVMILVVMLLAIVASTSFYLPIHNSPQENREYRLAYLSGYLSHLLIIIITFLIALWELAVYGSIGLWFYVLLIAISLTRTVIYTLLNAFIK